MPIIIIGITSEKVVSEYWSTEKVWADDVNIALMNPGCKMCIILLSYRASNLWCGGGPSFVSQAYITPGWHPPVVCGVWRALEWKV